MEQHSEKPLRQTPAKDLGSHDLVCVCLEEVMRRTPIMATGNERFIELWGELVSRVDGPFICDGCREKARKSANEPQVAS